MSDQIARAHYYGLPGEEPRGACACGNPVPVEPLDPPQCPVCGAMFCDKDCVEDCLQWHRREHMEAEHEDNDT